MLDTQFFEDEVFEDKSEIESSERKKLCREEKEMNFLRYKV